MADDTQVDLAVIQRTQQLLGKYIQRPQLTDKLLKRPPFRFIHDIVTAAVNQYAVFPETFTLVELNSENIKDKEGKVKFLEKLIAATSAATGEEIKVRASKIVAGSDVEQTNKLLQALAKVIELEQKSHSKPVKKETTKPTINTKQPHKTSTLAKQKPVETPAKVTKVSSKPKVDETPKTQPRDTRSMTNVKGTPSHVNTASHGAVTNKTQKKTEHSSKPSNGTSKVKQVPVKAKQTPTKPKPEIPEPKPVEEPILLPPLDNDTVAEVPAEGRELLGSADSGIAADASPFKAPPSPVNEETLIHDSPKEEEFLVKNNEISTVSVVPAEIVNGHLSPPAVELESFEKPPAKLGSAVTRSFSARPKSSRRPPSRASKEKFILELQPIISKGSVPNVVVEGNEDVEEDNEEQIVDSAVIDGPPTDRVDVMNNPGTEVVSGEQGKLVEQILNAQRELNVPDDTERGEDSVGQGSTVVVAEFERMKGLIQNAARAALPIGQLLPSVHEDVESMLKEWNYWKNEANNLEQELQVAFVAADPELESLRLELVNLENNCTAYRAKVATARAVIYQS